MVATLFKITLSTVDMTLSRHNKRQVAADRVKRQIFLADLTARGINHLQSRQSRLQDLTHLLDKVNIRHPHIDDLVDDLGFETMHRPCLIDDPVAQSARPTSRHLATRAMHLS